MLDLRFIRENPQAVKEGLAKKNSQIDIDEILKIDDQRREIIRSVEGLKSDRNRVSSEIAKAKKAGENADDTIKQMRTVGEEIAALDIRLRETEQELNAKMIWLPNLPHESVPVGDETANTFVREWGNITKRDFEVLPHWEIGEKLGILDIAGATKISGAGFYLLRGLGARLQRALVNYMLNLHTQDGFLEMAAPYLVTSDTMFGTGQLPKLDDDMYRTSEDNMYLIPTAEVSITNYYKQQIIEGSELPIYMVGHSPCFRRESGAAGKDTRGMLRVHQFDKVEMVKIVHPDNSYDELEQLVKQAEKVLQGLELPYRIVTLAGGDLSFAAAKCYDLELWAPGVDRYLEISSVSNFEDFQARRMNCRFRDSDKKVRHPHTLNGSGVALARLIAAILENYQNADGSVTIPTVLRPLMGGTEKIG